MKTVMNLIRLSLVVMLMLTSYNGQAAAENAGADFLVQTAINELKKGNKAGAVHEFSKALMLEPGNELAQAYLRELGYEQGLYANSPTAVANMERSRAVNAEFSDKMAQLQRDKEFLNQQIEHLLDEPDERPSQYIRRQARKLEREVVANKKPFRLQAERFGPTLDEQVENVLKDEKIARDGDVFKFEEIPAMAKPARIDDSGRKYRDLANSLWEDREQQWDTAESHYSKGVIDITDVSMRDNSSQDREITNVVDVLEVLDMYDSRDVQDVIAIEQRRLEDSGDTANTLQYNPPVQPSDDPISFEEYTRNMVDGYHSIRPQVNSSSAEELSLHLWVNEEQDNEIYEQFAYQHRLIHMLNDFLQVKEAMLEDAQEELLSKSLELSRTELLLLDQIQQNEHLHRVYGSLASE